MHNNVSRETFSIQSTSTYKPESLLWIVQIYKMQVLNRILLQKIATNNTLIATKYGGRGGGIEVYFERQCTRPRIGDSIRFPFLVSPALPTNR
jgi:hypothetical protein